MRGEGFYAEGFGGVVAGVENVHAEFFGAGGFYFAADGADERLHSAPEKAVMHEEERDAARDGFGDDGFAGIDDGGDF